ncbi:MAG TPA: glycosyltransferase family 39 protein [Coriobacteriia bacterium]
MRERAARLWRGLDKRALAVALVAAGVRLFWIAVVHAEPVSDFAFYFSRAGDLAAGKGYLLAGHPTAYWPPGYPFFLAAFFRLFGSSLVVVRLLNVAMWTASAVLMCLFGKRLGGPSAGLVAGLVVALYPEYVFFTGLVASEGLFVLQMSVVALLLAVDPRSRRQRLAIAAAAGLLLGWGVITRPASVLLPLTLCVAVWLLRRREQGFTTALVIGICALLAMAPWVIRNRVVMGEWVIATNGGTSVWGGAHEGSTGTFLRPDEPMPWMRRMTTTRDELHNNAEGGKAAVAFMREHPWAWLSLAPTKLSGLFAEPTGIDWNFVRYDPTTFRTTVRSLGRFENLVIRLAKSYRHVPGSMRWFQALEWILGTLGLILALAARRKAAAWPLTIIVYWVFFQITLSTGQPRYLVSTGPLLAPGLGFLWVVVATRLRRGSAGPLAGDGTAPSGRLASAARREVG